MELLKEIIPSIFSWPTVAIVGLLGLRASITKLVNRLIDGADGRAKLGPIEVQLGKIIDKSEGVVERANELSVVMAESRLTELQVTLAHFGPSFPKASRTEIEQQISELQRLIALAKADKSE